MTRRLFNFGSALSLLLCLATVVFWVRGCTIGDYLRWYRQPRIVEVRSNSGLLSAGCGWLVSRDYPPPQGWEATFWPFQRQGDFEANLRRGTVMGFGYEHWQRQTPALQGDAHNVTLPYWFIFLCFAGLPAIGLWRWRRRRARQRLIAAGHCPRCGYDLRATPGRCPECGTPAGTKPQVSR